MCVGMNQEGKPVYLRDIWPSREELQEIKRKHVLPAMFQEVYSKITEGNERWNDLDTPDTMLYPWDEKSTYIQKPPFFAGMVCVCAYVCACMYVRVHACVCACMRTYVCVYVWYVCLTCLCVCVHARTCECLLATDHEYASVSMQVCILCALSIIVFCRLRSCLRSRALIRLQYYSTLVTQSLLITSHQLGALLGTVQLLDTSDLEGKP